MSGMAGRVAGSGQWAAGSRQQAVGGGRWGRSGEEQQ